MLFLRGTLTQLRQVLIALAAAHHPDASARPGSGVAGGQAVVAPESGVGVDLSLGSGLSHFGRVAQDNKSTGEAHSVLMWSTEVGGRVWFPSGVFVSASMPVATTFVNGATWTGIGDVGAGVGLARTVGHTDGWVTLGPSMLPSTGHFMKRLMAWVASSTKTSRRLSKSAIVAI